MNAPQVLASLAEQAILQARNDHSKVKGNVPEVEEVARLVLQLPAELRSHWGPHLKQGEMVISGVFCHKTPQAKHLSGVTHCEQSPELGDLLLCVEQIVGKKQRSSSALLLQAKMG